MLLRLESYAITKHQQIPTKELYKLCTFQISLMSRLVQLYSERGLKHWGNVFIEKCGLFLEDYCKVGQSDALAHHLQFSVTAKNIFGVYRYEQCSTSATM